MLSARTEMRRTARIRYASEGGLGSSLKQDKTYQNGLFFVHYVSYSLDNSFTDSESTPFLEPLLRLEIHTGTRLVHGLVQPQANDIHISTRWSLLPRGSCRKRTRSRSRGGSPAPGRRGSLGQRLRRSDNNCWRLNGCAIGRNL